MISTLYRVSKRAEKDEAASKAQLAKQNGCKSAHEVAPKVYCYVIVAVNDRYILRMQMQVLYCVKLSA